MEKETFIEMLKDNSEHITKNNAFIPPKTISLAIAKDSFSMHIYANKIVCKENHVVLSSPTFYKGQHAFFGENHPEWLCIPYDEIVCIADATL